MGAAVLLTSAGLLSAGGCGPERPGGGIGSGTIVASQAPARRLASLRVEPANHRLGRVFRRTSGETLDVKTILRNTGDEPLHIREVHPNCACSAVTLEREHIPPGAQSVLTTRIRLGEETVPRRSSVRIVSSDHRQPEITVGFEWIAVDAIRAEPPDWPCPPLRPGHGASTRLAIIGHGLLLCDQCEVRALPNSPLLRCTLTTEGTPSRRGGDHLDSRAGDRPIGTLQIDLLGSVEAQSYRQGVALTVLCGGDELASLRIPVQWTVSPLVRVTPGRLSLSSCRAGDRITRRVLLDSSDRTPFRVLRVTCDDRAASMDAEFDPRSDIRHTLELRVTLPQGDGPWRALVRIETDRPDAPDVTLPLSALLAERGTP